MESEDAMTFAMQVFNQIPQDNKDVFEEHLTAVLLLCWSALWGTFGTEYARGFIEAQLKGMEPDVERVTYSQPPVQ